MQSESLSSIAPIVGGCESQRDSVGGVGDLGGMSLELLALSDSELSEEEKQVTKSTLPVVTETKNHKISSH